MKTPSRLVLSAAVALALGFPAHADTWDGGGSTVTWSDEGNWLDNSPPVSGDTLIFDQASRTTNTDDLANFTAASITFATSAGAFVLAPAAAATNTITLGGNITDSSVNLQTSSIPLILNADRTVGVTSRLGSLTLSGVISGAGFGLTKTGAGLLTLSGGTNSFTNLTVTGGTVAAGGDGNFGATTGVITLDGGALRNTGAFTLTTSRSVLLGNAGGGSGTIDTQAALTTAAVFAGNGGTGGLVKTGNSILQLNGANTYTGATTINQGQVTVDRNAAAAATINSASTLVFSGQSTQLGALGGSIPSFFFQGQSNVSSTQTFNGLTLQPGSAQIQSRGFGTGNATLALGAITHNAGGAVSFSRTTNGTAGGAGIITTSTANEGATGILGGWAVINAAVPNVIPNAFQAPTDYATNDGAGNVVAYTGYTTQATGVAVVAGANNNNRVVATGAVALTTTNGATDDINTLSLAPTATGTTTVTVGNTGTGSTGILRLGANGGLLNGAGAGALIIGNAANNGTLTAGGAADTAGEINIVDATGANGNTNITINSVIANNGAGAVRLTYSDFAGASTMVVNGNNTYTGGTTISTGRVQANANTAFGTGAVTVLNGAQAFFGIAGTNFANPFNIIGQGGVNTQDTPSAVRFGAANQTISGTVTLLGDAIIGNRNILGSAISGQITGGFSLTIAGQGATGGSLTISNTTNNYTGNLNITDERVILGAANVLSNGAGVGNVVLANSATSILDLNGNSETINGLSTGAASFVQNGVTGTPAAATLTIGDGDATTTAAGIIRNSGGVGTGVLAVTKIGGGTQIFTGANTYGGGTTISAGTLLANNTTGSATGTGAVTISGTGILGGSGTVTGPVNVNAGGTLAPGASPGILNTGALNLGLNSFYIVQIDGTTVGTNYDQTNVTGAVSLDGSNLVLDLSTALTLTVGSNETFGIINNDDVEALTGTFASGNNTTATFNGVTYGFAISYVGNISGGLASATGGNDVVLTNLGVVPEPSTWAMLLGSLGLMFGITKFRRRAV